MEMEYETKYVHSYVSLSHKSSSCQIQLRIKIKVITFLWPHSLSLSLDMPEYFFFGMWFRGKIKFVEIFPENGTWKRRKRGEFLLGRDKYLNKVVYINWVKIWFFICSLSVSQRKYVTYNSAGEYAHRNRDKFEDLNKFHFHLSCSNFELLKGAQGKSHFSLPIMGI